MAASAASRSRISLAKPCAVGSDPLPRRSRARMARRSVKPARNTPSSHRKADADSPAEAHRAAMREQTSEARTIKSSVARLLRRCQAHTAKIKSRTAHHTHAPSPVARIAQSAGDGRIPVVENSMLNVPTMPAPTTAANSKRSTTERIRPADHGLASQS